jgi:hypothetical protein
MEFQNPRYDPISPRKPHFSHTPAIRHWATMAIREYELLPFRDTTPRQWMNGGPVEQGWILAK